MYRLDKEGTVVQTKKLNYLKNHDFEGIAYDTKNDEIVVAVEGSDNVLVLDRDLIVKRTVNIDRRDDSGRLILGKDPENGLEGITVNNGEIYLSNQSFQRLPKEDPSVVIKIAPVDMTTAKIAEVIDHGFLNISGLAFYKGYLYMVTDSGNLLIQYDLATKQVIKTIKIKTFDEQLKGKSIEGVTFDDQNNIYFADDNGGTIYRYKFNP